MSTRRSAWTPNIDSCVHTDTPPADKKKRDTVGKQLGLLRRKKLRIIEKKRKEIEDESFLNSVLKNVNADIAQVEQKIQGKTTGKHVMCKCVLCVCCTCLCTWFSLL